MGSSPLQVRIVVSVQFRSDVSVNKEKGYNHSLGN